MTNLSEMLSVFSQMPIPIFFKNDKLEYVWCNDAFLDAIEKTKEETIGKTAKKVFAGALSLAEDSDARLLDNGDLNAYNLSYPQKDGSVKVFLVRKYVFRTKGGGLFIGGVLIDTTEKTVLEIEYKTAIETTHDGFLIIDAKNGKILDINELYCKITGRTREEMLSLYIQEVEVLHTPEEMSATFKAIIEKQSHSFVATHRRKDGSIVKLETNARYSEINGGIIFVFMKDITENLRLQAKLIEGEKIFRQLADNVKDVFWVKTPRKMLYINKAFESMWGVQREAVYKNIDIFVNSVLEDDRERVKNAFVRETLSEKHIFDEEYRIVDSDGNVKWIHTRSYPIFNENGAYIRSAGIASDISTHKQLEEIINKLNHELINMVDVEMQKRMEKELAFEGIFNVSGSCLCIVDAEGIIKEVNRQFLNIFKLSDKKEAINLCFKELLAPSEHEKAGNKLKKVLGNCEDCVCCNGGVICNKPLVPYEWRFKRKNGTTMIVLANVVCFEKSGGKRSFIVSFTDITRIRELETREKERERLLAHQSKMAAMGEMIGAIAHQWRQPLNLLGILVQNVRYSFYDGELDGSSIEKFTTSAMEQINFMSKTIDDFRGFFKSDKEIVSFDLATQAEKSVSMMSDMLKAHEIIISLFVLKKPIARGYPNEVGQVMLNLLSNAKDALLEAPYRNIEPKIVIVVDADERHAIITMQDNGGGINANIIDRIFEPYFTTKDEKKGTGIGLYMSKTIIENNMGGVLEAENRDGGALFTVKIPLADKRDIVF